jgi:hypothetical protein
LSYSVLQIQFVIVNKALAATYIQQHACIEVLVAAAAAAAVVVASNLSQLDVLL